MAKRRARPLNNPIRQDLIEGVMKPILPPAATDTPGVPPERVGEGIPDLQETQAQADPPPQPKRKKPRRAPSTRQKDGRSRWTEPRFVQIKARFVHDEADEIEQMRRKVGELTQCNVSVSHLTRALWSLALQAGEDIEALSAKAPHLQRPPHGNPIATAEYEDALARFLLRALKQIRPAS